jgi:hypothetical protein
VTRTGVVAAAATATVVLAAISGWVFAAGSHGTLPAGDFTPLVRPALVLEGPDAAARRLELLRRAAVYANVPGVRTPQTDYVECLFLKAEPSGTSAKFDCVLDGGEVVKVKYSRNPEIHAEAAATRLVSALGLAADHVALVARLRCYGCPRYPFLATQLLWLASADTVLGPHGLGGGYTDFDWVAVERKLDAPAIELPDVKGFAWFELQEGAAPRADVDALRLLAVFLAHWDNKSENQRLVCLDDEVRGRSTCERPLLMMQDLGATFGPTKVNLARWADLPVWTNPRTCEVSMGHLPWNGGTFPPTRISEEGRLLLARKLAALDDADVRRLFRDARFPEFYAGTDNAEDLRAWTAAFGHRVHQIVTAGPCLPSA